MNSIAFSDEKIFIVEEKLNKQNDRIYAAAFEDIPEKFRTVPALSVPEQHHGLGGCISEGQISADFHRSGGQSQQSLLPTRHSRKVVKPEGQRIFKNEQWTFQQDSAPAHSAKINQSWCDVNLPDFIKSSDWPSSSPDLNVMDYAIWGILEARVNATKHKSLESLKRAVQREWEKLSMEVIRTAVNSWRRRLQACVDATGGRFE